MTNPTTPELLSEEQIAEIEARANAATEGPWTWEPVDEFEGEASNAGGFSYQHIRAGHKGVADTYHASGMQCPDGGVIEPRNGNKDDANFIAHARTDIPALCQTVRAAWAANEQIISVVDDLNRRLAQVEKERLANELHYLSNRGIKLSEPERRHLLDLLFRDQASGEYRGRRQDYYKRCERLIAVLSEEQP